MKFISRGISRFCYNHPKFGIQNLMKYIILATVAVFIGDLVSQGLVSWFLRFYPELILKGQVWRLVTFVFVPVASIGGIPLTGTLSFALSSFLYYFIGTALERHWGATRFTVFYLLGVVLNVAVGLVAYAALPITSQMLGGFYFETAHMHYINLSLFFSFATLYPDMQFRLYFLIPVKVKWLAWLDAAIFAFDIFSSLGARNWLGVVLPIVAILNYLIFFWDDLTVLLRQGRRQTAHSISPKTINFKKAQREIQHRKGPLHKCTICGITEADHPDMEFRYCSKCNGYYCYCMDHISNHTHVQ